MVSIAERVEMYPGKREDVFFHFKRERRAEGHSSVGTVLAQHLQSPKFNPSVVMLPALGRQRLEDQECNIILDYIVSVNTWAA